MKRLLILFFSIVCVSASAQTIMNIHQVGEPILQIPINQIDSITYSAVGDPGAFALVTTLPMSVFTATTATLGGVVDLNNGSAVTHRGIAWSALPSPTTADSVVNQGSGSGTFSVGLTGLATGVMYYARAYATNNAGTAYGNEVVFQVTNDPFLPSDGVTDIDGNFYNTILVSSGQEWMAENLRVCRYANGDSILHLEDNVAWSSTIEGAWTAYNHNQQNMNVFGKLYNGWAVEDVRNVCPIGWHVPSENEWTQLHSVNGGLSNGGGALKATGISIWLTPNTGATNSSGFTALPGGTRLGNGNFQEVFGSGYWWTSTGNSSILNIRILYYTSNGVWTGSASKLAGQSIRCVKD